MLECSLYLLLMDESNKLTCNTRFILQVLKNNHDAEFRSSIGAATHNSCNATTMVYYDKFEEVENELDIFLNEHGKIQEHADCFVPS